MTFQKKDLVKPQQLSHLLETLKNLQHKLHTLKDSNITLEFLSQLQNEPGMQKQLVSLLFKMKSCRRFYLVDKQWWQEWMRFVDFEADDHASN